MAAAAYTTDLATFKDFETTVTLGEMVNYTGTGTPAMETDFPIQGTQHASAQMTKTGLGSIMADYGSNVPGWVSGWSFFVWGVFLPANAINTEAAGGMRVLVGPDITTNFKGWIVGGRDAGRYPYGGWQNFAVNPEVTADYSQGTVANYRWVGVGVDCTSAIARGYPLGVDCIRYGRGELRMNGGDLANGYATFAGAATANDASTARWGLFQAVSGSYLWKGLMTLGYTSAIDFRDSNRVIVVDNTKKVLSTFNKIEIRQASSRVDWTNISIQALGTVSKGALEVIDDCDVNLSKCQFTDMGTFIFKAASQVDDTVFRRCETVTGNGAAFNRCTFEASPSTSSVVVAELDRLNACSFVSDGSNHAVELTSIGDGTMVWNCTTSGYAASDGSTGNEVLYINTTSSANLAISVTGGASQPSVRKSAGYTGTVSFPTSITLKMIVTDEAGNGINGALAYIDDNDQTPYILNTTTANDGSQDGVAQTSYSGSTVNGSRWRVRKYGYKQFKQLVNIGTSDITIYVTLAVDPQQV